MGTRRPFWEQLRKIDRDRALKAALNATVSSSAYRLPTFLFVGHLAKMPEDAEFLRGYAAQSEAQALAVTGMITSRDDGFWPLACEIFERYPNSDAIRSRLTIAIEQLELVRVGNHAQGQLAIAAAIERARDAAAGPLARRPGRQPAERGCGESRQRRGPIDRRLIWPKASRRVSRFGCLSAWLHRIRVGCPNGGILEKRLALSLLQWSEDRPDWQRDALRRIATCERLTEEDRGAVRARVRHAHGIAVVGDITCTPLAAAHLPHADAGGAPAILCGIGPVRHLDRLAEDQELRFAVDGITVVFGDNGTGKSGYARAAKKLCLARVIDELRGDIFAAQASPPAQVRIRYRSPGGQDVEAQDWTDGQERPAVLARTMVLDSASVRVYVDGRNEITYLPREIEIAAQLGELCTALGDEINREAEAIEQRCRVALGAGYRPITRAGRLVSELSTQTTIANLPSEEALRAAATWDDGKESELGEITAALTQDPAAQAAARRRAIDILRALADDVDAIVPMLDAGAVDRLMVLKVEAQTAAAAAALSAQETFAGEPLAQTGQAAWQRMYVFARQFAAEAGIRAEEEDFQLGDPCPTCQRDLDAAAAQRLNRFDQFVRGAAAAAAVAAGRVFEAAVEELRATAIPAAAQLQRNLAEFRGFGAAEAERAQAVVNWFAAAMARRDAVLANIGANTLGALVPLPVLSSAGLREAATTIEREATALETQPARDPQQVARQAELQDAKRLSQELDAVLVRRAELELRLRLLSCRGALDTRAISQFATRRRRELVTPELQNGITAEIRRLDLDHVPLRFEEASNHGRNFFDLALDTRQRALKSRVLSEGEQRALGIACFFAEMNRMPGKHGIIVDDPVSSLDLQRLRKIAERLVEEAAGGRQVIVFTHHLVFYQEILAAAAARTPQVRALVTLIGKRDGRFGLISEDDEPWIAKKVGRRIAAMRERLRTHPHFNRESDEYRRWAKDFYTDLRETWERLVEEVLLNGVVERFCSGVETQSLKEVVVEDTDYQRIYAAMKRVSEFSGHDMAAGRQLPMPDLPEMGRDLDEIDAYRNEVQRRRDALRARRRALEEPPLANVV